MATMIHGTLRFLRSEPRFSVYLGGDGNEVCIAHGSRRVLLDLDQFDLAEAWDAWRSDPAGWVYSPWEASANFLDHVRTMLIDPDDATAAFRFCEECMIPHHSDEVREVRGSRYVCEPCMGDHYFHCEACNLDAPNDETATLIGDETIICRWCRDGGDYYHCDACSGYYHRRYADDHRHPQGMCCDSPAIEFIVPNNGDGDLANDTRATIALPSGEISPEGIEQIQRYLRDYVYEIPSDLLYEAVNPDKGHTVTHRQAWLRGSARIQEIGTVWQNREGNYTKRLSRFMYKEFGVKVPSTVVSAVGCIARDQSTAVNHVIETTRLLNQSARQFAHSDSCWFTSYYASRCALKTNGGFGIRTFRDETDEVTGRVWVQPLKFDSGAAESYGHTHGRAWKPTFDVKNADAFAVFNGYGALSGYVAARIVSHMMGMTYRKIAFSCSPMYVNGDSGYIVAPEDLAAPFTDGELSMTVTQHATIHANESTVTTDV